MLYSILGGRSQGQVQQERYEWHLAKQVIAESQNHLFLARAAKEIQSMSALDAIVCSGHKYAFFCISDLEDSSQYIQRVLCQA
jgi:hypothetical protein